MATLFNDTFQKQLLYIFCVDKEYVKNYGDVISIDYFDSNDRRILFRIIKEYVDVYDTEVTINILFTKIKDYCQRNNVDNQFCKSYLLLAKEIFDTSDQIESIEFIKDSTVEFIKRQEIRKALIKAVDIIQNDGDYEQIVPIIEEAVAIDETYDPGLKISDLHQLKQLYREAYSSKSLVKTGFSNYDKALLGGLGPGEVHCICAAPKGGKTTFGCNIGAYNVALKKNVFHFTLEIKDIDLMVKYACILGQLSYTDFFSLSDEEYQNRIKKFTTTRDNLFIKYYVGGTVNCGHIRSYMSKIIAERKKEDKDFKADLIIVDYDDYILPVKTGDQSDYNNAGYVYDDLIYLANYFSCPLLTFSQTVRAAWDSYDKEDILISAADVAHSAKRVHKCYSFSSINFKNRADSGILYVDRNRKGPGSTLIHIKRDLSKAKFYQDDGDNNGNSS